MTSDQASTGGYPDTLALVDADAQHDDMMSVLRDIRDGQDMNGWQIFGPFSTIGPAVSSGIQSQHIRLRLRYVLITSDTNGLTVQLRIGETVYEFIAILGVNPPILFPLVIERGVNVEFRAVGGAGIRCYLIGLPE